MAKWMHRKDKLPELIAVLGTLAFFGFWLLVGWLVYG